MAKILVIEDDSIIRRNIVTMLELEGHELLQADCGTSGIESVRAHQPDLIICDIMMPGMDGFEVLRAVRASPASALVPFIFLTAKVDRNSQRSGMNIGADDYITKPFEPDDLLAAIKARLHKQAAVDSKFENLRRQIGYMLPHELRTPLMSILGFAEILESPPANPDPQQISRIGRQLLHSGKQLEHQIENYLLYTELSLLATDKAALDDLHHQGMSALGSMLTYIAGEKARQHKRKQDLCVLGIEDIHMDMSESHLHKLLSELLDNAFKFSAPGTPVEIRAEVQGRRAVMTLSNIANNGFKPEEAADIGAYMQFQRKYYEQQGAGLGLAIARQLALLYGGRLTVHSGPEAKVTVKVEFAGCAPDDEAL